MRAAEAIPHPSIGHGVTAWTNQAVRTGPSNPTYEINSAAKTPGLRGRIGSSSQPTRLNWCLHWALRSTSERRAHVSLAGTE